MNEPLWSQPRSTDDVGGFVSAVRRSAGRTQAEVATAAGVPRRFVNELENGHATIYASRLARVLQELGIRVVFEAGPAGSSDRGTITVTGKAAADVAPPPPPPVKDLGW